MIYIIIVKVTDHRAHCVTRHEIHWS